MEGGGGDPGGDPPGMHGAGGLGRRENAADDVDRADGNDNASLATGSAVIEPNLFIPPVRRLGAAVAKPKARVMMTGCGLRPEILYFL